MRWTKYQTQNISNNYIKLEVSLGTLYVTTCSEHSRMDEQLLIIFVYKSLKFFDLSMRYSSISVKNTLLMCMAPR